MGFVLGLISGHEVGAFSGLETGQVFGTHFDASFLVQKWFQFLVTSFGSSLAGLRAGLANDLLFCLTACFVSWAELFACPLFHRDAMEQYLGVWPHCVANESWGAIGGHIAGGDR